MIVILDSDQEFQPDIASTCIAGLEFFLTSQNWVWFGSPQEVAENSHLRLCLTGSGFLNISYQTISQNSCFMLQAHLN